MIHLKNRAQGVRDMTRETICHMVEQLGARYVEHVARSMVSMLTKGYMLHVLGYTLYAVLQVVAPKTAPGDLDHCLPLLLDVFMADALGATAKQKEVKPVAVKMKEAKSTAHAFKGFELLASVTSYPELPALLEPVKNFIVRSSVCAPMGLNYCVALISGTIADIPP